MVHRQFFLEKSIKLSKIVGQYYAELIACIIQITDASKCMAISQVAHFILSIRWKVQHVTIKWRWLFMKYSRKDLEITGSSLRLMHFEELPCNEPYGRVNKVHEHSKVLWFYNNNGFIIISIIIISKRKYLCDSKHL